jgi:hypothetical protein
MCIKLISFERKKEGSPVDVAHSVQTPGRTHCGVNTSLERLWSGQMEDFFFFFYKTHSNFLAL